MDLVINYLDQNGLDRIYEKYAPADFIVRDFWLRQYTTILILWIIGGWFMYLSIATASYVFLFDKSLKKHKLYLPNQIEQEIQVAMTSIPIMAIPSAFIFLAEVRGFSRMYESFEDHGGILFILLSIPLYLVFTDTGIYWIHRFLHIPALYSPIHKLHHKWIISTPFASHAFHPLDGFLQSIPYHIYVFLFPFNKIVYLALFFFVNMWTISIHDNYHFYEGKILNGTEHHTIHHRKFNYNYGQYFTFWDRVCSTHRLKSSAKELD
jgi:lathosterol oxidase